MRITFGTLYLDTSKTLSLEGKLTYFCHQFYSKHNVTADMCEVNPEDFESLDFPVSDDGYKFVGGLRVFPSKLINKNSFFIGSSELTSKPLWKQTSFEIDASGNIVLPGESNTIDILMGDEA